MKPKSAAHFLLTPELAYSPPNDALVTALLDRGYRIDLFAPGSDFSVSRYGPNVAAKSVAYGYRWLAQNLLSKRWFGYSLFSGTTEDPMAVAGNLARLYRKPCVTMADEIKNANFSGNRSQCWKALCRQGMRASTFTVVNEAERVEIQRGYAGLPADHQILLYPGCFREPPPLMDRRVVRRSRGLPDDALVVCYSGVFTQGNGGLWLAKAIAAADRDVWFWGQVVDQDELVRGLLKCIHGSERLVLESERLSWRDAWASMSGADIGIVVYLQKAPQFRHMGTASNRLCMFLAMGLPVITSRQPSFEFIERYDCGVLVDNEDELVAAIGRIAERLDEMKANALRCAREYIDAPGAFERLKRQLSQL